MALQNAHSGYEYQDIFTALRFVDVLLSRASQVKVDVKLFKGDLFDDLTTVWNDGQRVREQLKHSVSPRPLERTIFTSNVRDCRLDRLVAGAIEDHKNHCSESSTFEYRLIVSDLAPTDTVLTAILKHDTTVSSLLSGFPTKCYRLNIDELWPKTDALPKTWKRVITLACKEGLTRVDFEWFAQHFVLELEAPKASFDLTNPGPVERLLLNRVTREVGAEVYPNADRSAIDVASALIIAAYAARSGSGDTTRKTLLRRANLRDDFGSVARAYPVETAKEIEVQSTTDAFVLKVNQALEAHVPLLVLGPPGQGKTWACDKLTRRLQQDGWLVANHYCYLNVAEDESRDIRVQQDAIIGSLLAQVAAQEPSCTDELRPRYAAHSKALISALQKARAKNPSRQIALVVDGLDHVTRVLGTTTERIDPATALARELSLLDVPDGVVLIVACQRGAHDEPLRKASAQIYDLPQWDKDHVRLLGEKLAVIGTPDRLKPNADSVALIISPSDPQLDDLVTELTAKSKGNALYVTYCYRELKRIYEVASQSVYDLIQALRALPAFDGTMKGYYEYLLQGIPTEALIAVNALAMLEFAVTRDELKAIYPIISLFIDSMVDRLMPVLIERGMQGGIRVYHESFQRFLLETRLEDSKQRKAVLEPVIGWLRAKGFFKDARAFRFLSTLLAEIGDDKAVCGLVDKAYVANAITACHGEAAIVKNIAVAAEAAVRLQDWKALVRYTELAKEISIYAFERMDEALGSFSDIPIALYGATWLADRLLFEGHPVFPARLGLQLCEAIDRAGGVPPWKEYLDLFELTRANDTMQYSAEQDSAIVLAQVRGVLRLRSNVDAAALANWLDQDGLPNPSALVTVLLDIYQSGTVALEIIQLLPKRRRSAYVMALARQLSDSTTQQQLSKGALLKHAVKLGLSPRDTIRALEMGVDPHLFRVDENELITQTKAILNYDSQWTKLAVMKWVAFVCIAAHTNPAILNRVMLLIQGKGWYRCWLEYVVEIARFKVRSTGSLLPAFKLLANETNPLRGKPRVFDILRIYSLIDETLRLGLKHVSDEEWPAVLRIMREVSNNTTGNLQNSLYGPLSTERLLQLASDFTTPSRRLATRNFIEDFFKDAVASRTYYDAIAQYYLLRARLSVAIGDTTKAEEYWTEAARLNTCYGHRKDITIFELLESMSELIDCDIVEARERLVRLESLVRRVLRHTDHKETRHALPIWWGLIAKADGIGTGNLIARQMLDTPNRHAEQLQDAQFKLHIAHGGKMSLPVRFASRLSLGYQFTSGDDDAELLRLLKTAPLDSLSNELAADAITSLFQDRITDDHDEQVNIKGFKRLASSALELNGHALELSNGSGTQQREEYALPGRAQAQINSRIGTEWGDTPIDIARAIRKWSQQSYDFDSSEEMQKRSLNAVVEALGWRLLALCQEGNSETAENLLRFLAEHVSYSNAKQVMGSLAQGFERFGLTRLAVIAYVFAYTKSKGGSGWLTFGGKEYEETLRAAVALNPKLAFSELGMAIVDVLNGKYYGAQGISQALVQAFCSKAIGAADVSTSPFELWDATADVIEDRLPPLDEADEDNNPYVPTQSNHDTIPELESAIAATIVSSVAHPEKPLKRGALLGTAWLIKLTPSTIVNGLRLALKSNLDPAGKTWLLWLILQFEAAPYPITHGCLEELMDLTQSSLLTVRSLATQILTRAGVATPPPPATSIKISVPPLSNDQQKRNYTLAIEELERCAGERVILAERLVPQLGVTVSERLGCLFDDKEFQCSYDSQVKGLTHPASNRQPDAYTLEQEAVERTLQEVAAGARVVLARENGIVDNPQEFEKKLAEALIDNPELPLRVAASRIPRPKLHTTLESENTAIALPSVEQGPYKGWLVLGAYERRITPGDRYKKTAGKTTFISGSAELSTSSSVHNHPETLGFGSTLLWLASKAESLPPIVTHNNLKGPLVGVEACSVTEYFGLGIPQILLVPHLVVTHILDLKTGPILDGLTLLDEKGQKAIVARTWRTKFVRGNDFGPVYPLIQGMDVLIRPDLLEILEKKFSPNIICFCSRHTETLSVARECIMSAVTCDA